MIRPKLPELGVQGSEDLLNLLLFGAAAIIRAQVLISCLTFLLCFGVNVRVNLFKEGSSSLFSFCGKLRDPMFKTVVSQHVRNQDP